ncbi:hypothetical protein [Azospirillum sp. sgz302134]
MFSANGPTRGGNVAATLEDALLRHDRGGAPARCLVRLSGDPDGIHADGGALGVRRVISASRDSVRVEACAQRFVADASGAQRPDAEPVWMVERTPGGWLATVLRQIDVPWALDAEGAEDLPATAQAVIDQLLRLGDEWSAAWRATGGT